MAVRCRLCSSIFVVFLVFFLLANSGMAQRVGEEEEQLEMERHGTGEEEGEEGSGNSFNPDDEDDFSEASGLPPSEESAHQIHQQNAPSTTISTTRKQQEEEAKKPSASAEDSGRRPSAPKIIQRPAVSPRPPANEAEGEGDGKQQFQSALLYSTIAALTLLAALAVLVCCCCCCRQSRRRGRQQDGYTQGREQAKHYL